MENTSANNKRIAKNTLLLYFRTLLIMAITLYTSRVILNALGVEDYGIYNVVGGVVAMFSLVSGSLSNAISRFITFELGRGDIKKLNTIFSTSVNIQIGISVIVLLLGVLIGGWFLNAKMNIPPDRMIAANWVLCCSLLMFCINLISLPYNACIIAHERMAAFAYVSILDATLRLLVCYLITVSPFDKLISYAVLLVIVALIIRIVYGIYCNRRFEECHYRLVYDRSLLKQMGSFAGWQFLANGCWLFNTQGVNILINMFFGVALNAARGVATQVDGAIQQFVNNFMTAVNPQITKDYAAGRIKEMFTLVCRGAKFSYFLLMLFAIPVIIEADYILRLWLKTVPDHTVIFLRLTIIGSMLNMLGGTGLTACFATGKIKIYSIWITSVGILVFPLTWIAFEYGLPVESTYIIFIIIYIGVVIVRLYIMKYIMHFPPILFVRKVFVPMFMVTPVAVILPLIVGNSFSQSFLRLCLTVIISLISSSIAIYFMGLTANERKSVATKAADIRHKFMR
ncbi:lipopolysaccharide biosynthesis protein [Bacteroides gallinaceum]|uniref:lipopolysaccharide biosynthesis protein n=1 Tax=Bacteroides gallinaceum TaxID=1462571 RepID=UPI00195DC287|nr:lipopolysaccharide biosynthesis protein [Bacteroides gallinaceum]MBM6721328.1 lipopolysaccharide biosynthesis protein [Bacteroides gallinaceum]